MQQLEGLDPAHPLLADSDLKPGTKYKATIAAMNMKFSEPLHIYLSPLSHGTVPFNHLVDPEKLGSTFLSQKFRIGQSIQVSYTGNNRFSLLENAQKGGLKRGDLVTARFVNGVRGKGITVQIDPKTYGFIELSEITDALVGNVVEYAEEKGLFAARIIDTDKTGKFQLSCRESVVEAASWSQIRAEGTTARFQEQDEALQAVGNMRNKIVKFGANVALKRGDLAVGYVANIGKAGCFLQIGHGCVARAGLNELSDSLDYNFDANVPIGRLVVGRITRVRDKPTGDKQFDFSLRESLVVYGVGVIERGKLVVGAEVETVVMAVADGKAFAQIKGSYIKIKVKGHSKDEIKVGDHVTATLKKVTKEKISSVFVANKGSQGVISPAELKHQSLYRSVDEEATKALPALSTQIQLAKTKKQKTDFDLAHINAQNFMNTEEQVAAHIRDLNELKGDGEDADMDAIDSDDSDAEVMKRLIDEAKEGAAKDAESGEDEDMDDEEGEGEDSEGQESE